MTTSVTAAQIATLRRLTDEPLTTTYSDATLTTMIEAYPLVDELGTIPYTWDLSTDPPTKVETPQWIPTYDLQAAAGDVWSEKAAALAELYTFNADGGSHNLSEKYDHYVRMASLHRSRRAVRQIEMTRGI
jgi:hypothetical protein